ncbi:hypothetical protein LTR62_006618 [Meristemomyces frigidus]|uniref:Glycoside hydrolase family 76 protein n=1 Tax=Meristemomyces frigidus TaxID=1508187 RepID=A0AAN7YJ02_9PEZI|nr:hypothetical protein LTR62_006618 [Meristemomyces frigidus]
MHLNHDDQAYWFTEFRGSVASMQDTFWNGTQWPAAIQWTGAFLNTLLAASEVSFTNALSDNKVNVSDSQNTKPSLSSEIEDYFTQIEAYYSHEETTQIFDAAYDDVQWVVLEWLAAIRFIDQYNEHTNSSLGQKETARFAHRAHIFYHIVQDKFNTSLCGGGLTWNPALATYKNAITNELFLASSIAMYLYFPGDSDTDPYPNVDYFNATNTTLPLLPALSAHDPLLLDNAVKGYAWFKAHNFTTAQGLIVDGFHISKNQTTCDERNEMVYTYNQGVLLSGLRGLWEATGNVGYLTDGYAFVNTVINATGWNASDGYMDGQWAGLGRDGIMEDYCDASADCSQDNQIFKGIYFHHLDLFCEPLRTSIPLVPELTHIASAALAVRHQEQCAGYAPWVEHNAHAALSTRNSTGIMGGWWGANYKDNKQDAWAPALPSDSIDLWNEPEVLQQPPWVCQGQHGCRYSNRADRSGLGQEGKTWGLFTKRMAKGDINDQGRGRTIETHASGVSVAKAANDFLSRSKKT